MPNFQHEKRYRPQLVCGVDEAGRGPLAGPVVAAAVIFKEIPRRLPPNLNDSKLVAREHREELCAWIQHKALVGVGVASVEEIDGINILQATLLAMRRAVEGLPLSPHVALIDGNRAPDLACESLLLIGGDGISASIAAASIIAKVTRDKHMAELHETYPHYGFATHAGYATPAHRAALRQHGPCPIHRRSFAPVRELLGEVA